MDYGNVQHCFCNKLFDLRIYGGTLSDGDACLVLTSRKMLYSFTNLFIYHFIILYFIDYEKEYN